MAVGSKKVMDETYDLRGLNMVTPDQVMTESSKTENESPYTINSRMFAREDGQTRVASRTRKGSIKIGTAPVDQLSIVENTAAVTIGDTAFGDLADGTRRTIAVQFVWGGSGFALTRFDLELRKDTGSFGHVIVAIYSDSGGLPSTLLATSSIASGDLTTSQSFLSCFFMDAPQLGLGNTYWAVAYIQDNGRGTYYGNQSATATGLVSTDEGTTWSSSGGSFRYKAYGAPYAPIKSYTRRYPSTGSNATIVADAGNIRSLTDAGVSTTLDATLDASATYVRFEHIDDKTIWVNGINNPRWTTDGTAGTVVDIPGAPAGATHVIAHQNRLFYVVNKVLVRFSNLYPNISTIDPVNFFYVPNPKSPDPITAVVRFQNNLVIFTHETKHIIRGSDISTFQRDEAIGTKGAIAQESVVVAKEGIYFMSDDGMIYLYNGINDVLISDKVQTELQGVLDKTSVRMHLYNNQLRIYYHKSPDTLNNRMLLYDITYKQWFMDTGKYVTGSLEWTQDDNELIEFSSRCVWMFQGEQGYSDVGKPIAYKYWTPYKKYGSGASKKRVKSFRPSVRLASADYTLMVGKDIDFLNSPDMREYLVSTGGAKWGQFVWGDGTKWGGRKLVDKKAGMSGRGRHIQYRFEATYVEAPVELYGYIAQLKEGTPK